MVLKLGIIGCGRIVEFAHVDALKSLSDEVEVATISDPSQVRLEVVGGMLQIGTDHRYADYREMLKRENLAVILAAYESAKTGKVVEVN
jgi:predicted dehydrogenase